MKFIVMSVLFGSVVACSSPVDTVSESVDMVVQEAKTPDAGSSHISCTLDQGQPTSDQIYVCAKGLYLCSSPVDGGVAPQSGCVHPSPTVVVKGVEWDTWCCN